MGPLPELTRGPVNHSAGSKLPEFLFSQFLFHFGFNASSAGVSTLLSWLGTEVVAPASRKNALVKHHGAFRADEK